MRAFRLSNRRLVLRIVTLCLVLSTVQFLLDARGEYDRLELWTINRRFQLRGPRPRHGDVVVVGIDDASLGLYGKWPWPRSIHADLIRHLTQASARLIVFDLLFSEPDKADETQDDRLARELQRSGRVVMAMQYTPPQQASGSVAVPLFVDPSRLASLDLLRARSPRLPRVVPGWLQPPKEQYFWSVPITALMRTARACGFIDVDPDEDGIYRRVQPVDSVGNQRMYVHLGVAAAAAALGVPLEHITLDKSGAVRLGDKRTLRVDPDGKLLVDFAGGATRRAGEGLRQMEPSAFPYYSYSAVLGGRESPEHFRNKIVFVGAVAKGLGDVRPNPFDAAGTGVDINAHVTDAILAGRPLALAPPAALPVVMLLLTFCLCLALTARTPLAASFATAAIELPYLAGAHLLFAHAGLIIPVATPSLTVALCFTAAMTYRFATEQREQRRVRRFFERYVTRDVAAAVLEDPTAAQMGGRRSEVTLLFADIRGFTSLSEKLPAEIVIQMLNEYFAIVVPIMERYQGTINAFMGDGIFAFWGAPLKQADQAERAVVSGLEMLEAMPRLHAEWQKRDLPALEIGIGVHVGAAVIGNIGTENRSHYTAIGDDVNTAARLEGLNSREGTKFLVSEAVYPRVAHLIEARRMAPMPVKNKAEPLNVYEVLGRKGSMAPVTSSPRAETEKTADRQ